MTNVSFSAIFFIEYISTTTFSLMRTIYVLGIRLADNSGWVAIGETQPNEGQSRRSRVKIFVSK